jgi:N-acetylmuramoyl-L-alanine amidase
MLVVATIGHAGRPSKPNDRGASYEGWEEVSLVRLYTDAMDARLRALGHRCILLSDGEYSTQWERADALGADIYLNCHVNAGGGDYGLFLHDHRSTRGKALATSVSTSMAAGMGWSCQVRAARPDTNGVPRDGDFTEAYHCISGVKAPALCVEPYFIDGPKRVDFIQRIKLVGIYLADGLVHAGV